VDTTGGSVGGSADSHARAPSSSSIARISGLNLAGRLTSGAAALGLAVLSTNVLDTHGRGVYAILSISAGIAVTILSGGTPVMAADLIHGRQDEPVLHGASCAIAIQAMLVLGPLAAAISLFVSGAPLPALLCTATIAALLTYSTFEMYIAQARGDVRRVRLTDIAMAVFPLIVTAAAVAIVSDPTVTTLMAAWTIGAALTASAQLTDVMVRSGLAIRHAVHVAVSIARRSIGVALANATALLTSRIDVLVVAAVLSTSDAGVYSIPVALASSLLLLSRSLLTATYHPIMTAPQSEVGARLSVALRHSVIVVMAGGCLSVPVVAIAAGYVFGDAYSEIWRPYAILVPAIACLCVAEMLRHFLITRLERQREILLTATSMLVANGVLAVVGAAEFGLLGAAASTTITYAGTALGLVAYCARSLSVPMLEFAVPRRSDLASYVRVLRLLVARPRSTGSMAPRRADRGRWRRRSGSRMR
jgi:O-antigen/teichoic acid export membrane protein